MKRLAKIAVFLFIVAIGLSIAAGCGAFNSPAAPPVNPLCTNAAVQGLTSYWNAQVANADVGNMQATLAQAIAAVQEREAICKVKS
jgi:hypothetical protein